MFGLSGIALKIAIALALSGAATGAWFYVQNLRGELALAAERQARQDDVIKSQTQAMETIQRDIGRMQQTQSELNKKLVEAESGRRELENKFNRSSNGKPRDFGALAAKDPAKVEASVNRGTADALRCNELVSGSPLTEQEAAGKVRNSMCPNLLPAYTGPAPASATPAPTPTAPTPAPVSSTTESKPVTVNSSKGPVVIDPSKIKRAKQ